MKQNLVNEALKAGTTPQVLVNIVSRRVRQLGQSARPLVAVDPRWTFMDIALREVGEGKLSFELTEHDNPASANPRTRVHTHRVAA